MREICARHYQRELDLITTVPGISEMSAMQVVAELGVDMKAFITAAMLIGWAGLKPRNDESNGKFKSRKTTHGNKYLRRILIECSWAASKKQGSFYNRFSYRLVVQRKKSRMKVQVAIARKMLVAMWNMLSKNETYKDYQDEEEEKKTA